MTYIKTVIIGAGFGGLEATQRLKNTKTDVLLIDKLNHHLFQPLLYQVATAALSPGDIAYPVRAILKSNLNASFIMGTATSIDKDAKQVTLLDGTKIPFDILILAPGARHSYFGNDQWEPFAPGLKTIQDARNIRERVLSAFERAEKASTFEEACRYLRFAIVGGGPTGVEMAGAIAEIAFHSLVQNFRKIRSEQAKIFLIEGAPQILPGYPKDLADKGQRELEALGVTVLCNHMVTNITEQGVFFGSELLQASTVVWAAGNQASPLIKTLNTPLDRMGRAIVEKDLSIPGYDNIFVIGDAAHLQGPDGKPLPGLAPIAKQQGAYVAKIITKNIPKKGRKPFSYWDKGSLATIGKGKAVGVVKNLKFTGFFAWLVWCVVHILYLIGFRNRCLVLAQWLFWYCTGKRSIQLITTPLDNKKNRSS